MRLNHADVVLSFTGEPMKENIGTQDDPVLKDLTFRSLAVSALNGALPTETLGAEAKARGFALSMKFFRGKYVKLTVDERALIKDRAGKVLESPLTYGRLCEWLEGEPQAVATDEEDDEADGPDEEDGEPSVDEQP